MNQPSELTPTRAAIWAQQAKRINTLVQRARHALASRRADPDDFLMEAQTALTDHARSLSAAAGVHAVTAPVESLPLDKLDTPNSRALLSALRQALAVAESVDAERGRSLSDDVPLAPGESAGTDWAETLSVLVLRATQEVEGAQGRD